MNNDGFTLIEMQVAIFVFSVTIFLLNNLLISSNWQISSNFNSQITFLISSVQKELRQTLELECHDQTMILEKYDGDLIKYEVVNDNLVRTLNGSGHEIVMYDVPSFELNEKENICVINTTEKEIIIGEILNE